MADDFQSVSNSVDYDVIVVGAGLAGLVAAKELLTKEPTLRVLVLEAKNRIGGSMLTVPMKAARGRSLQADLGATWISKSQTNIMNLVEDFQLDTFSQYTDGKKLGQLGTSEFRPYTSTGGPSSIWRLSFKEALSLWWVVRKLEKLAQKVDLRNIFGWPVAESLDGISVAEWINENTFGRSARDAMEVCIRNTYGVEPKRVNFLYHLAFCKSSGVYGTGYREQAFRVEGGTQQIAQRVAEQVGKNRILLNRAVEAIEVDENAGITTIRTHSTNGIEDRITYTCTRVICAIPPNQCRAVDFHPPLSHLKRRLFECSIPGNLTKFIITFETAFWRENGLSGEMISTGRTTNPFEVYPVTSTFDYTACTGEPALVGFINEEYADMTKEDRCNAVVNDLMRVFGDDVMNKFVDYREKAWGTEPFGGGCPGTFMPCGTMDAWQTLRDPHLTVHFAGTAAALKWIGYMEGAVESGVRAAHEVLHQMGYVDKVSHTVLEGTVFDNNYKPPQAPEKFYKKKRSFWRASIFFVAVLCVGIYVYSKKYRLSYTARALRPIEKVVVKYSTGMDWP